MIDVKRKEELESLAKTIRVDIVDMIWRARSGHAGGSLSLVEILTVLYFYQMRIDPKNPGWEYRDRLVLSKGHAAPVLYAVLAEAGMFPRERLHTLRQIGSTLQGHPDMRKTPGVDITTGCLGEGLSAGVGMALGGALQNLDSWTYVVMGDGELQEGQVWEAALFASARKIKRLVAIVDVNGCMCDDYIENVLPMGSLKDKWEAFGWTVVEVDGHDITQLVEAFENIDDDGVGPTVMLANTCKGKGISFMENEPKWHGMTISDDDYANAMRELT